MDNTCKNHNAPMVGPDQCGECFSEAPKALKYDTGKPQLSLVSYESLSGEARAMEYGLRKYSRNNYKQGMEWSRLLDASMRHITKYAGGTDIDSESGLNHLYHAKACLGMLIFYIENNLGVDDR